MYPPGSNPDPATPRKPRFAGPFYFQVFLRFTAYTTLYAGRLVAGPRPTFVGYVRGRGVRPRSTRAAFREVLRSSARKEVSKQCMQAVEGALPDEVLPAFGEHSQPQAPARRSAGRGVGEPPDL